MKKLFIAILILHFNTTAHATTGTETQWAQAHASKIQASRVIFFGESHFDLEARTHYPALLEAIRAIDPAYDCLSFEMPSDHQVSLSLAAEEKITGLELAKHEVKSFASDVNDSMEIASQAEFMLTMLSPLLDTAIRFKNRVHAYAIDMAQTMNAELCASKSSSPEDLNAAILGCVEPRNRYMAAELKRLLKFDACKKIVAINGAFHLLDQGQPSIPKLLNEPSMKVQYLSKDLLGDRLNLSDGMIALEPDSGSGFLNWDRRADGSAVGVP